MPWPIASFFRLTVIPNGLVVEEALAAGLPVIVSDAAGDIASRVPEGIAGYVFPVGEASEPLRKRMVRVARSPALRPSPELTATMSVYRLRYGLQMPLWPRSWTVNPQIPVLQPECASLLGHLALCSWLGPNVVPGTGYRRSTIRESVVRERPSSVRRVAGAVLAGYRRNHLARNSGWLIFATGMNGLLGLVFWAEATRSYSESAVGSASAVLAAMTFASTVGLLGLGKMTAVAKILPRADDETWSTTVNSLVIGGACRGAGRRPGPHARGAAAVVLGPAFASFAGQPTVAICAAVWVRRY